MNEFDCNIYNSRLFNTKNENTTAIFQQKASKQALKHEQNIPGGLSRSV